MIEISELFPDEYTELNLRSKLRVFRFRGDEVKDASIYEGLPLNTSQSTIVQQLLLLSAQKKGLTLKSFASILESKRIKFSPETLRRVIGELKKRKILEEVEISLHGEVMSLPRCLQFCDISLTLKEQDSRSYSKLKEQNVNEKRGSDLAAQKEALERRGLSVDDGKTDKKFLPRGALYSEGLILKEIQQLSPDRANGSKFAGQTFDTNSGKFHLEAKAPDQIATKGAIATLVVIINIAVAYNSKMLTQKRFRTPFQDKEIPIHIADILELRGIRDSGQARNRIRKQISWLRETIYRASDLQGILDKNLTKVFRQSDYQFFIQVTSNADEAPVIVNNRAKVSPNLYFITFNPIMEKELCEEGSFFSLPWRLMQAHELLLFVYINFRRRKLTDEVIVLDDLRQSMYYEASTANFQDKLEKELISWGFQENAKGADFNLCGYYIIKSVNHDGEPQYRVQCNEEEMINESGAFYRHEIGDRNAPQLLNPLKQKPQTINLYANSPQAANGLKTATEIKHDLSQQFAYHEFQKSYVVKSTLRTKQFRRMSFGMVEYAVTYYDTDDICNHLAAAIAKEIDCDKDNALEFVMTMKAELHPIRFGDQEVTSELFWEFLSFLKGADLGVVSPVTVLEVARTYRRKKVTQWVNRDFKSLLEDFTP